ncbi:hypothetical protein GCM10020295_34060 [Streptomyces cinereospinus]
MTVVDPLRGIGEEAVGAAAFIWSTVPDRGGPRDAFKVYQLLHEWQDFSHRLHEAGASAVLLGVALSRGRVRPGQVCQGRDSVVMRGSLVAPGAKLGPDLFGVWTSA